MGSGAMRTKKKIDEENKAEFNICKVKSIDSYVGNRKFSQELKKKASVITRLSSKESIEDRLIIIKAVSSSCIDEDSQDLKITHFQSVHL